jgi:hypothetical protein
MPVLSDGTYTGLPRGAAPARVMRRGSVHMALTGADAEVPEWKTDAWKRHVEAEARRRLRDRIHGVGARR